MMKRYMAFLIDNADPAKQTVVPRLTSATKIDSMADKKTRQGELDK